MTEDGWDKRKRNTKKRNNMFSGALSLNTDDHEEKPSKRVPSPFLLLLLGFYLLIAFCTQLIEDRMPLVVTRQDTRHLTRNEASNVFSEESAKDYLMKIIGDQPRVAGAAYHFVKTRDLKDLLDDIATGSTIPVWTDWQYASGDYWLEFSSPHVNRYQNLSNVLALLEGESGLYANGTAGSSLLVNCHYDSVPYAIGASDNGIFCAAMVEILSKFTKRNKKFKHNVVFLFNGAEETPLQGSHAFLSHPWSNNVVGVINLDSAGMNGLPNMFQITDPRLLTAYQRTNPRPSAQSLGELLFKSGIVPSDTDFRIFRDFGDIRGVDIAFAKWGNVYHTRNDEPSLIKDGVIQAAGNMLMGMITALADQEDLIIKEAPSSAVYYDYLTMFMLSYSSDTALVVDSLVVVLAVSSILYHLWVLGLRWSTVRELLWSVLARVVSAVAGLLTVTIFSAIMIASTTQMRYLSEAWIVVPLYWLPYLIASVAVSHLFDAWRTTKCGLNRSLRAAQAMCSTRMVVTTVTAALLFVSSLAPARYLLTVPLALSSVAAVVTLSVLKWIRPTTWQHLLLEACLSVPGCMFLFCLSLRVSALLLPIAGRSGSACPDCTTAAVSAGLALLVASVPSGIELLFSRKRLWIVLGGLSAACVVIMFIPFSPYRGMATQRHYWFHTEITTYDATMSPVNRTSGVLVTKLDAYSVQSAMSAISELDRDVRYKVIGADDCESTVYCDMPLYRPRFDRYLVGSLFVYTDPPAQFTHEFRLVNRSCVANYCQLNFTLDGPAYNLLTIFPRANVSLTKWSFSSPVKPTLHKWSRPLYVVVAIIATYSEILQPLEVTLELEVPPSVQSDVSVEISHHGHQVFSPEHYTAQYRRMLDAMPDYFNIASFLTFKSNYVF